MALLDFLKPKQYISSWFGAGNKPLFGLGNVPNLYSQNIQWFIENHHVFAVTDWIAQKTTQARWELVDEEGTPLEDHPLLSFIRKPNPLYSFKDFVYTLVVNDLIEGGYFIQGLAPIIGTNKDRIQEIVMVPTNLIKAVGGDYMNTPTYKLSLAKQDIYLKKEFSYYQKRYSLSDKALSPFEPLKNVIEASSNSVISSNKVNFNLGVQGFLTTATDVTNLSPEQASNMQRQYEKKYLSVGSTYRKLAILAYNMKWVQVGERIADLKLNDQDVIHLRRICAAVQVGSQLFNDTSASTYNNMEEAVRFSFRDAVFPQLDKVEDMLNNLVAANHNKYTSRKVYFKYYTDHIEELQQSLNDLYDRLAKSDELTDNEKRIAKGYAPLDIPLMDIPRVSKDSIPITMLQEYVEAIVSKAIKAPAGAAGTGSERILTKIEEERLIYDASYLLTNKFLLNEVVFFGEDGLVGRIEQIHKSGRIQVPDYNVILTATEDDPVAVIRVIIDKHLTQHLLIQHFSKLRYAPKELLDINHLIDRV